MKLKELLKNIEPVQIIGDADVEVSGVNIDSRKIKEGHLFVAMKGTQVDGHKFIPKALELGAKSVLCEDMPEEKVEGVTYIQVASTEDAVGKVATFSPPLFRCVGYRNPSISWQACCLSQSSIFSLH